MSANAISENLMPKKSLSQDWRWKDQGVSKVGPNFITLIFNDRCGSEVYRSKPGELKLSVKSTSDVEKSDAKESAKSNKQVRFSLGKVTLDGKQVSEFFPEVSEDTAGDDNDGSVVDASRSLGSDRYKSVVQNRSEILRKPILRVVQIGDHAKGDLRFVILRISNKDMPFLVDTGAQVSIVKEVEVSVRLQSSEFVLKGASGKPLQTLGVASLNLNVGTKQFKHKFHVCPMVMYNILGADLLQCHDAKIDMQRSRLQLRESEYLLYTKDEIQSLGYVLVVQTNSESSCEVAIQSKLPDSILMQCRSLTDDKSEAAEKLLQKFSHLFDSSKMGVARGVQHEISLTDDRPKKQNQYRLSVKEKIEVELQIQDMLSKGIIRESKSPWASPIVLVTKKDGSSRLCGDFRKLNSVTKPDAYPLPLIDDILDSLNGATHFSCLDLKSGFHQIPMRLSDTECTAIITPSGQYEYLRMPFGLINATATFQRVMNEVLRRHIGKICHVFVDDIIVFAKSFGELLTNMEMVLGSIDTAGLTLNAKKCELFRDSVNLLGHVVSKEGSAPNPDKIKVISSWSEPTNRKQLRAFLGLCNYYRRFIEDFSKISSPLSKLTSDKNRWEWGDEQVVAFNTLKQALVQHPILSYFDPSLPIIIDTDASQNAIGAVLSQEHADGVERVVAYYSRCLSSPEVNYCTTRKELLAIIDSLRNWRHYVAGDNVVVRTDHSSLIWLRNFKRPEGQLARWIEKLAEFNITLQYRKGSSAGNADSLSRRPCANDCTHCSKKEEKQRELECNAVVVDTPVQWSVEQDKNEVLKMVKSWLAANAKSEWEEVAMLSSELKSLWSQFEVLSLKDGVICRRFLLPYGAETLQIIVPEHLREELVIQYHEQGHFGVKRTQDAIASKYYWFGWKSQIAKLVALCKACIARKGPMRRVKLPLKRYIASEPMQRIAIDMVGPLPLTSRGNKYLMMVGDYFSKWAEAFPVANQEASTVAGILVEHIVSRFGVPSEIHTDQGRNFTSKLIELLCQRLGVVKTRTTPYRPQSDGQVERFNRTLLDSLAKLPNAQTEWDVLTPLVMMYYRATVHAATGLTPAMLMLGRELKLPADLVYPPPTGEKGNTPDDYLSNLEERLKLASEFARKHLRISWDRMNCNHLASRKNVPRIDVNREAFVFNPSVKKGVSPKLASFWKGPFRIQQQLSPYLYRVNVGGRRGTQVIHRCHIYQPVQ